QLQWMDNSATEDGFSIEQKTGAGAYTQIVKTAANQTSYSVNGLSASTSYSFRIRSTKATAFSDYSNEATDVTWGTGNGLKAEYFNGTNFNTAVLIKTDTVINMDWGTGSPASVVNVDQFSARWSGQIEPRFSGIYTFYITSDNGRRLWIDNQLLIDKWIPDWDIEYSGAICELQAGKKYDIKLDYFEDNGGANCKLQWSSDKQVKQIIPKNQLYSLITTAVNDPRKDNSTISIYPNPTDGKIFITVGETTVNSTLVLITINDIHGQAVYQKQFKTNEIIEINSDKFLSKGIYFLSLQGNEKIIIRKIVVQ
nr:T9SS type A sorting domain-containing protein [Bacteroidota bacterium]